MSGRNGGRILVVDDAPDFRAFVVETRVGAGYSTLVPATGR